MNILKKTILFTMPAIMAGCGQRARYVITDKADGNIVYTQVAPVVDTTRHVMVFDQETMDLYKYLSVGDTIEGNENIEKLAAPAHWSSKWDKYYTIIAVNGVYTSDFIQRGEDMVQRDSLIQQMHSARQR